MLAGHALLRLATGPAPGGCRRAFAHHAGQAFDASRRLDGLHVLADQLRWKRPVCSPSSPISAEQPVDQLLERVARLVALAAHARWCCPRVSARISLAARTLRAPLRPSASRACSSSAWPRAQLSSSASSVRPW
jgi:hypothetical protein